MYRLTIILHIFLGLTLAQDSLVHVSPKVESALVLSESDSLPVPDDMVKSANESTGSARAFVAPPRDSGVARIVFTSPIDSVIVELDGQRLGVTPLVIDTLSVGTYSFVCTKKGFYGKKIGVTLLSDSAVIQTIELRAPGALTIVSQPEGATILLNKQRIGVTPYTATLLRPEQYQVLVLKEGYATIDTLYTVGSGAQDTLGLTLVSLTPTVNEQTNSTTVVKSPEETAKRRKTIAIVAASIFTLFIAAIFIMEAAGTE